MNNVIIDFDTLKLLAKAGFVKVRRKVLDKIEVLETVIEKIGNKDK